MAGVPASATPSARLVAAKIPEKPFIPLLLKIASF
jgi:hypothetical protein